MVKKITEYESRGNDYMKGFGVGCLVTTEEIIHRFNSESLDSTDYEIIVNAMYRVKDNLDSGIYGSVNLDKFIEGAWAGSESFLDNYNFNKTKFKEEE